MRLICIGVNHKNALVEIREQSSLSIAQQNTLLSKVASGQLPGVTELVILSTCNRTELYAVCSNEEATLQLIEAWSYHSAIAVATLQPFIVTFEEEACIRHLFEVSAGLDSQVIGEPQILGQVADAYERARLQGAVGTLLSALMQHALRVGKRIRSETALGDGALSISSIAASHSKHIFGDLATATVLVIGTGEMARGAVAALVRQSVDKVLVTNHNLEHAREMAAAFDGEVVPFTQLAETLSRADLVITAVAAPHPILQVADMTSLPPRQEGRPLIIFDIALPRNVEPEVGTLVGVRLYNLDDLQAVTDDHYAVRQAALPDAALIVAEELSAFQHWQLTRVVGPTIQGLRRKVDAIRLQELQILLNRLPEVDDRSRQLINEFSQRLVNKLLHNPTLKLKEKTASDEGVLYAHVIHELFALDEESYGAK